MDVAHESVGIHVIKCGAVAFSQVHDRTHAKYFSAETCQQRLTGITQDFGSLGYGLLQRDRFALNARAGCGDGAFEKSHASGTALVHDFEVTCGIALDGQIVAKQAAERTGHRFNGARLSKIIHSDSLVPNLDALLEAHLR